jgi:hypothetical protein
VNIKDVISFYKMNRLWGDSRLEAAYWALRGKAFLTSYEGRPLTEQILTELNQNPDTEDKWWQAIK